MRTTLLFIYIVFSLNALAQTNVNIQPSLEWACVEADIIVKGEVITSVITEKDSNGNRILQAAIKPIEILKGGKKSLYVISNILDEYNKAKLTEGSIIVFFLYNDKNCIPKFQVSCTGGVYKLDNCMPQLYQNMLYNDEDEENDPALVADGFKILQNQETIALTCKNILQKINQYRLLNNDTSNLTIKKRFLKIPISLVVNKKDNNYLSVPDFLFPQATTL